MGHRPSEWRIVSAGLAGLKTQLRTRIREWTDQIIDHARQQHVFFPGPDETPREEPAA